MSTPHGYPQLGSVMNIAVQSVVPLPIVDTSDVPVLELGTTEFPALVLLASQTAPQDNGVYVATLNSGGTTARLERHSMADIYLANGCQVRACLLGSTEQLVSTNTTKVAIGVDPIGFESTEVTDDSGGDED